MHKWIRMLTSLALLGALTVAGACGSKDGHGDTDSATDTEEEPGAWVHGYWVSHKEESQIWTWDVRADGRAELLYQETCYLMRVTTLRGVFHWELIDPDTVRLWSDSDDFARFEYRLLRTENPSQVEGWRIVIDVFDEYIGVMRRRDETVCLGYQNSAPDCGVGTLVHIPCPLPSLLDEEEEG